MSVAKKEKRKIVRDNRTFYWLVKKNGEVHPDLPELYIISDDKKFIVSYLLCQKGLTDSNEIKNSYITVVGKEFKGLDNLGHRYERFIAPKWYGDIITPSIVSEIIDWCFIKEEVIPVDYNGEILLSRP